MFWWLFCLHKKQVSKMLRWCWPKWRSYPVAIREPPFVRGHKSNSLPWQWSTVKEVPKSQVIDAHRYWKAWLSKAKRKLWNSRFLKFPRSTIVEAMRLWFAAVVRDVWSRLGEQWPKECHRWPMSARCLESTESNEAEFRMELSM